MNTPNSVKSKIDSILDELPRYGCHAFADTAAERERVRAILSKILEKRAVEPQLSGFEEKMVAKALNVYEPYIDAAIQRKQAGEIIIRPLHIISSIQPEQIETVTGEKLWIKSVLKTRYALTMPDDLILKLESVRDCNFRIRMEEGFTDPNMPDLVGLAHSDQFSLLPEGYLSRDEDGVPLLYATARSTVPLALDMQNVVKIEFANRNHGGELWRHPRYQLNDGYFTSMNMQGFLLRSRLMAHISKAQHRYEVKLYDHGKLIAETHNFQIRQAKHVHAENENLLSNAALKEVILKFTPAASCAPEDDFLEKSGTMQKEWFASIRAKELAQIALDLTV